MSVDVSMQQLSLENTPPELATLFNELTTQYQLQLDALQHNLQDGKNLQTQAYASGMLKISRSIRTMKVSEFNALYKMDLIAAARRIRDTAMSKKRDRCEATPNPTRTKKTVETPSRTVRKGEALFSENGSPLDPTVDEGTLIATVAKKRKGLTNFELHIGEGKTVNLADPQHIANLNKDEQQSALSQLLLMQNDIAMKLELLQK